MENNRTVEEITQALNKALNEVEIIDSLLDQYEQSREKKILADVTSKMKQIAADLRELTANPHSKTQSNAPLLANLSNKMKKLVGRTKSLASATEDTRTRKNSDTIERERGNSLNNEQKASVPKPLRGWLRKQGEDMFKAWKKRFFAQSGSQLHYFVNETDSDPHGSIDLSQVSEVQTINSTDFDIVTSKRTYKLQIVPKASMGEDKAEMEYWVRGITNWLKYTKAEEEQKIQRERETSLQLKALQERMSRERDQENQLLLEKKKKEEEEEAKKQEEERKKQEAIRIQKEEEERKLAKQREEEEKQRLEIEERNRQIKLQQEEEERKKREEEELKKQFIIKQQQREEEEKRQLEHRLQQEEEEKRKQMALKKLQLEQELNIQHHTHTPVISSSTTPVTISHSNSTDAVNNTPHTDSTPSSTHVPPQHHQHHQQDNNNNVSTTTTTVGHASVSNIELPDYIKNKNKDEAIQILLERLSIQETNNQLFIKLQDELRQKEKQYEILRGKQKLDQDGKKFNEEKIEILKADLKRKDEEMAAKDKHIKQLSKKLKEMRKEWITKDSDSNGVPMATSPGSTVATNLATTPSKSWQLNPEVDMLNRQIKQLKDANWAHQTQNSTLCQELDQLRNENKAAIKVKDDHIKSLEKELSFVKNTHQELRDKFLVQQLGLLNPQDESLLGELQKLSKEYFFCLALSCKLTLRKETNVPNNVLYERAIVENVPWTKWADWIPTEMLKGSDM